MHTNMLAEFCDVSILQKPSGAFAIKFQLDLDIDVVLIPTDRPYYVRLEFVRNTGRLIPAERRTLGWPQKLSSVCDQ